ncbi:MAG: phosphatidylglycerophosphatase A [Verrucomicrobia bacterium]|nr:phosphatidylglycerophosphatase A [Verrucomicrobiota bacterium]
MVKPPLPLSKKLLILQALGHNLRLAAAFIRTAIATVLFSGYAPVAPGTAGTAVIAVAYYLFGDGLGSATWAVLLAVTFGIAVYTAGSMARAVGVAQGKEEAKDPGVVVIDEAIGFLVTVAALPHGFWTVVAGFFLFRLLDIVKPPPCRWLEKLPGGWGIVLDDVFAGVYGQLLLRLLIACTGFADVVTPDP